jgi:hypothetical protein
MIEFQGKVSSVAATLLASVKGASFCLPPPVSGVQMQRVLFDSINFEHDQPTTATVFQHHPWRAKEGTTIDKLQTQIVIAGTIDFVRVQAIQAERAGVIRGEAQGGPGLRYRLRRGARRWQPGHHPALEISSASTGACPARLGGA